MTYFKIKNNTLQCFGLTLAIVKWQREINACTHRRSWIELVTFTKIVFLYTPLTLQLTIPNLVGWIYCSKPVLLKAQQHDAHGRMASCGHPWCCFMEPCSQKQEPVLPLQHCAVLNCVATSEITKCNVARRSKIQSYLCSIVQCCTAWPCC